ncbi:unnamed protein product [Rotaria magnacalcarata]
MDNQEETTMNDEDYNLLASETEEVPIKYQLKPLEEQVLSQKLSQLSTTCHQVTEHLDMVNKDNEQMIPYYLSNESKSFEQILNHVSSKDSVEELRQMALLIYQVYIIHLEKSLWITYLKAGTGKIQVNQVDNDNMINPQICPVEVQQLHRKQSTYSTDNVTCLTYVTQHLYYFQTIETFVQQGLESVRLQTEHQISIVQYNYNDCVLELQYLEHSPTSHQKKIVKQLTHAKYQEEITKEEYNLLKQRISFYKSYQTPIELAQETFFNAIENGDIRQKSHDQYINIAQQAKEDMLQLYLSSAKAQMYRYRKQLNSKLKQFWLEQRSLPKDKKLTALIINLIEQRWKNMSESVQYIYPFDWFSKTKNNMKASSSSLNQDTQRLIGQQQQLSLPSSLIMKKSRKKRHGDRKLQRFKKKCLKRGLTKEQTQNLIDEYNRTNHGTNQTIYQSNNHIDRMEAITTERMEITISLNDNNDKSEVTTITTTTTNSNKRKQQMTPSSSQRSTSHPLAKRIKKSSQINITSIKPNYRLPMYLKVHPNLLFRTLCLQLKYKLKKKNERRFIHHRLQLLDQQYRLELRQNLWQSYLALGSEKQVWPNQVTKMAKTNEHVLCEQFVKEYLNEIKLKFDQCTNELRIQVEACPTTLLPLKATVDQNLKEFIEIQQKYLSNKMNFQLTRYRNMIHEKELFQTLSTYTLTSDQKNAIDKLVTLQNAQLQLYEDLLKLETGVLIDILPRNFDKLECYIAFDHYFPLIKDNIAVEFKQKHYKIIQEAKRTWLNMYVNAYESKIQDYKGQYEVELHKFELKNSSDSSTDDRTTTTTTVLFNSFINYINHRTNRMQEEIFYDKIPNYRRQLLRFHRRLKSPKKMVTVCPNVIVDLIYHPFTATQLNYLSRGPTYIRPNPSVFYPSECQEKRIEKEHDNMMKKLKYCMSNLTDLPKIPQRSPLYTFYSDRLRSYLTTSYMTPLPLKDQIRALQELKLVKSIRRKLKKYKLILRETDKSGVLHIGRIIDYERKAAEYRQKTGAYEELTSNPFNDIICNVTHLLNQLKMMKKISEWQRSKLIPIREKTELAYKYFLPKSHKKDTPLRPIVNTIHTATKKISQFLDKLIRPLFDRFVRQTTIVDGADLLDRLEKYIEKGNLNSSTLFITFDITNLYTMLPQEESLAILTEFLRVHHCEIVNGISIDTIVELARIVLQANAFVYNNKFYRQIIGGAMGSAFTLTLANIFMWKWERQTILLKLVSHEVYGRYIDDVFFTSNESEDNIKQLLEAANHFHPNIKLEYHIAKCVPFLDILIHNNNGNLATSVYHKPSAEPTVVSFLSDHPRHTFRNVIRTSLTRAIRYSSTFEVFNNERRAIRLMLLYNRYPSTYINEQFRLFFADYMSSSISTLLPLISDESQFFVLRQKLSSQPTAKQTQVVLSATTVDFINHLQSVGPKHTTTMKTIVKRKDNKFKQNLFVHFTHEARLKGLAREIHMIHDSYFKNTIHGEIRLVVGYRNNPNIEFELSRKRPSSSLLKDPLRIKSKQSESMATS